MRFARIVVLDFEDHHLEPADWSRLSALTAELHRARSTDPELPARLADADGLLVPLGVTVTRAWLDAAPRLRYVGVLGTSKGRIDAEAGRRGITVRNVPGYSTEAVAELATAIILDHLRGLSGARARAAGGDLAEARSGGRELRGRRVGIVGLGAIGRRVAEITSRGFDADVCVWSRTPRPETGLRHVALDELLTRSEIVSVHVALTPETRGLLDARRLACLARDVLLVHLAPPELLDLAALRARLGDGSLHFVTDHGDELDPADLDAVRGSATATLYPPIGYATLEARLALREGFLRELEAFVARSG